MRWNVVRALKAYRIALCMVGLWGSSVALAVTPAPSSWPAGNALNGKPIYPTSCEGAGCHTGTSNASDIFRKVGNGANNPTLINNAILSGKMRNATLLALTAQQMADIAAYLGNPNVTATAPAAAASPTSLSFVATTVGATSASQIVTLTNGGTAALGPITFSATGAFTVTPGTCTSGGSVAAGGSCTVNVAFRPTITGAASGTLTLAHNASPATTSVALSGTGVAAPAPVASVSSSALTFASTAVGARSVAQTLTLTNSGNAPLGPLGWSTLGDFSAAAGTCSLGNSLAAGASCTISLTFAPTAVSSASGRLTLTHNASPSSTIVTLSGAGIAAPAPIALINVSTLSFATTSVGASSAVQTVTLSNSGNAALVLSTLTSANAAFPITGGSCTAGLSVAAGNSCTVIVRFNPSAVGASTGTLVLAHNANPNSNSVALMGTGIAAAPIASVTPNALSFSQVINTSSSAQTVTVSNTGTAPLLLSSVNITGAQASEFTKTPASTCGASVSAGASCAVLITFAPTATGARSASLVVAHNAAGSTATVALNGVGNMTPQPVIAVSNNALTFSAQAVGSNATQTITVTNAGQAALVLSSLTVSGTHSADYTLGGTCAAALSLAIGQNCDLTVRFAPSTLGARTANLSIASNATPVSIGLTGTATAAAAPAITLTPATQTFGNATVGAAPVPRTIALTNTGTAVLTLSNITVSGAGFSGNNNCGNSVAVGASCTLSLAFAPTAVSPATGLVTITSNAPSSPLTAALSGTGVAAPLPVLTWATAAPGAWPDTSVGATSSPISLTLFNQGPGTSTLSALAPTTGEFVLGGTCNVGTALAANTSCNVTVAFAPGQVGTRAALLRVTSNGTDPAVVPLSGTGVLSAQPMVTVSSPSLDFPSSTPASPPPAMDLSVNNVGTAAITLSSLSVRSGLFTANPVCGSLPVSLTPGQSCQIKVALKSSQAAEGTITDTLTIGTSSTSASVELSANVTNASAQNAPTNVGLGGCSLVVGRSGGTDPTLWLLCVGASLILWRRRRPSTINMPPQP